MMCMQVQRSNGGHGCSAVGSTCTLTASAVLNNRMRCRLLSPELCSCAPILHCADKGEPWDEGQPVSGVQYKDASGQLRTSQANLTVCCDGMYSTFRKKLAKPSIHHPSFFVALLLKNVKLPYPNHGHVVLCQPSPVLFYPISSKEVCTLKGLRGGQSLQQHNSAWAALARAAAFVSLITCTVACAHPTHDCTTTTLTPTFRRRAGALLG